MTESKGAGILRDIKPQTPVSSFSRDRYRDVTSTYDVDDVAILVGMSAGFVKRVTGKCDKLSIDDVLCLLDQDAFRETVVPRSRVIEFLEEHAQRDNDRSLTPNPLGHELRLGHALDLVSSVPDSSVQCVVTSTPYWGMRVYEDTYTASWSDGEVCPYGLEQTPEGFVRHTTEILNALSRVISSDGSIWWNIMDSFNTRTQVRGSTVEALRAMQGQDPRRWSDHNLRRYSAGHAYLKDGEQCLIPGMIAERASRIGLYVKTVVTWAKRSCLPEPHNSRVSRNLEYVLHITKVRTPKFSRRPYHTSDPRFGGRITEWETEKLSDVWTLNTSNGSAGHGAQFPEALPGRCIALTTEPGDLVLDPFVGSGNAGVAAVHHGCSFLGFDVSQSYLAIAKERMAEARLVRRV